MKTPRNTGHEQDTRTYGKNDRLCICRFSCAVFKQQDVADFAGLQTFNKQGGSISLGLCPTKLPILDLINPAYLFQKWPEAKPKTSRHSKYVYDYHSKHDAVFTTMMSSELGREFELGRDCFSEYYDVFSLH